MAERAAAYIASDRRLALALGRELADRTRGAALFADISGFTPLSEALVKELGARRGAEEVTRQLDAIYNALISRLDLYRGSVVSFSGDAITCWLDGDDGTWALACALDMQRAMRSFAHLRTPGGAPISLAIKVAVAAGPVRRFRVGDPQIQYLDVLAGALLDRLAATEHQAAAGEVVAADDVLRSLPGGAHVREWREERSEGGAASLYGVVTALGRRPQCSPWPAAPQELAPALVQQWMLPEIRVRIGDGGDLLLTEIRPAAVLFVRFTGIDYDADDGAGEKLDSYIRWVQATLDGHEGRLLQVSVGDKGSHFYAAFGAPVAHDDDPRRAVAAAVELQQALPPALAFMGKPQVGVAWGRMRTGPYGSATRRTYGVIGDGVNLAARLMSAAAPGEILVSQHVAAAVAGRFPLEEMGPVAVKGKQAPVLVSRVLASRVLSGQAGAQMGQGRSFSHSLVGRAAELAELERLLEQARGGDGQVLRLQGAAGVGKSHLSAALIEQASRWGFQVATALCQSSATATPYAPWRAIFAGLLHTALHLRSGALLQTPDLERFVRQVNPAWRLRLPLLGDLLSLPIADNATTAAFEPRVRQAALFELAVEMARHWTGEGPLLLLIDDAQWMDEPSQGLALALARHMGRAPLLLALVHRPPAAGASLLAELDGLPFCRRIDLDDLTTQASGELAAARLGAPLDGLALSLVQVETQGNPFFIEEVVDAMREAATLRRSGEEWTLSTAIVERLRQAGCLERVAGEWRVTAGAPLTSADIGLPDSVQGVVLSRIDRLPEAHKLTIKVASVVGRTFALPVVAAAHPALPDIDELRAQVSLLQERDFARVEAEERLLYTFRHAVTRDVAYETLLYVQRRQLHQAVGVALEQLMPDAVDQLAYHCYLGEDWARAFRYQAAAGQRLQRLFANQEGIERYRRALQAAEHLPAAETTAARQHIHESLGQLLAGTGQYQPALEHLQQALELATGMGDRGAQARACRWMAYANELQAEYEAASQWIERGLAILGAEETPARAELLAIGGLIQTRLGDYVRALQLCDACVAMAERLASPTSLAFAHNARGIVSLNMGDSRQAIAHAGMAAELYEQVDNARGQALSYNGMGNAYQNLAQLPEAYHYLGRAGEIFNRIGDELHQAFVENNLGEIVRVQGRLDEAVAHYEKALRMLEHLGGALYARAAIHMNVGSILVRQGKLAEAGARLRASMAGFEQVQARDFLAEVHRYQAELNLRAGDGSQAEQEIAESLRFARQLTQRSEEAKSLRVLAEIHAHGGHLARARDELQQSVAMLEAVGHAYEAACSRLALAQVETTYGNLKEASRLLKLCRAAFERIGATLEIEDAARLAESVQRLRQSAR